MQISIPGLFKHINRALKGTEIGQGLQFTLDELLKNLRELQERKAEGETVIDEFFSCYDVEGKNLIKNLLKQNVIEPSNVVIKGLCEIKLGCCSAKEKEAPITAVWAPPGRTQVNVCESCLKAKVSEGSWIIPIPWGRKD